MKFKFFIVFIFLVLYACTPSNNSLEEVVITAKRDTPSPEKTKPNWGYRFKVSGDFDGDGNQEILAEHFYSQRDHKKTHKFFHSVIDLTMSYDSAKIKDCKSFLICSNLKFDTIFTYGILGLRWLKNEGDLDQDGGDELSFVPIAPDGKSKTKCFIYTFKNGVWNELYKFDVVEYHLPNLPGSGITYLETGINRIFYEPINDSLNRERIKILSRFPGFITKLKDSKIRIQTQDEGGRIKTSLVDL